MCPMAGSGSGGIDEMIGITGDGCVGGSTGAVEGRGITDTAPESEVAADGFECGTETAATEGTVTIELAEGVGTCTISGSTHEDRFLFN